MMQSAHSLTADILLRELRHAPELRHARIERRGSKKAQRIVVGIGQVHPVLRGRFSRWTTRTITVTQHWIYGCCMVFLRHWGVRRFGQEGFSGAHDARIDDALLSTLRQRLHKGPWHALRVTADAWRSALGRGDMTSAGNESTLLNGLAVLQAQEASVGVFAIEHEGIHSAVGAAVDALQEQMNRLSLSPAYRSAVAKGWKNLTREEYDAVRRYGGAVRAYNAALSSPARDQAMFQRVVDRAMRESPVVFVLGQAHRRGFLWLAKRHLPADTAFLWITPPPLWWLQAVIHRALWLVGAAVVAATLWQLNVA